MEEYKSGASSDSTQVDKNWLLPAIVQKNERIVVGGFWKKMVRLAARIPFAQDALAAYYCAFDPKTPLRVRAILLGALAYFVMPADLIPDVFITLGFTDDAAVLAAALSLINNYITQAHRTRAKETLASLP